MKNIKNKRILIVRLPERTNIKERIFNKDANFFKEESLNQFLKAIEELNKKLKGKHVKVFSSGENFNLLKATELLSNSLLAELVIEPGFRSSEITALIGFGEKLHEIYPMYGKGLKGHILGNRYQDLTNFKDRVKVAIDKVVNSEAEVLVITAIDKLVIDMIDHLIINDDLDLKNFKTKGLSYSTVYECQPACSESR